MRRRLSSGEGDLTDKHQTDGKARPRTQAERSRQMRERIITAFISCIEKYGLAETSVSQITKEAGITRGAYLHHFKAKHLIYKDAALRLVSDSFRKVSNIPVHPDGPAADLKQVLHCIWEDVVISPEGRAFSELMQAARTDELVAQYMRRPALRALRIFGYVAKRRFPFRAGSKMKTNDFLRMTQWTLRGMAADTALVYQADFFHRQIDLLVDDIADELETGAPI
ncbi:MAG: TetR/AcrR family transcriptional regulator [Pseudomonadota bacterium]